jgi:tRNA(adenine34) deaminase
MWRRLLMARRAEAQASERLAPSLRRLAAGARSVVARSGGRAVDGPIAEADAKWMAQALAIALEAGAVGEVPVGALVVSNGAIVASSGNRSRRDRDATAHAELLVLRAATASLGAPVLAGCSLYVTLEPCAMCAGAIVLARVDRVVFGAWDDKAGMGGSVGDLLRHPKLNHRPEVTAGVCADASGALLAEFFAARRAEQRAIAPR